ncbi:MAG: DUF3160 domain-containing protein [Candidatus Omnitrophica bacterium]|nr:DUF3160 domain-containing protein [Candidatus Omnitrophota bacterium]
MKTTKIIGLLTTILCVGIALYLSSGTGVGDDYSEDLEEFFASFYAPVPFKDDAAVEPYDLPLDLNEVSNYDDVAVKLELDEAEDLITANGFAVIPYLHNEDDIVEVYENLHEREIPIFITSDSLLHLYHIQFDETLKRIEEVEFYYDIVAMTQSLLEKSKEQYELFDGDLKEAAKRNVAFFSVALKALCWNIDDTIEDTTGLNPLFDGEKIDKINQLKKLVPVNFDEAIPEYVRDVVEEEISLMEAHQGFKESPIFIYKEDYSQYVPRGHYTRSEVLKRYFKGMMWYGRMAFLLKGSGDWGRYSFYEALISLEDANIQTMEAALIVRNVREGYAEERLLSEIWNRIYSVTAYYVGFSDDLTLYEYNDEMNEVFGANGAFDISLIGDIDKLFELRERLSLLRAPEIYGGTGDIKVYPGPGGITPEQLDEALEKTKGLRLMGQRYIPDSYMMQQLVFPVVKDLLGEPAFTTEWTELGYMRCFPRGLDIMTVLGSERAREIIAEVGDDKYIGYEESLEKLIETFGEFTDADWNKNLYWSWLYSLKALLKESGEGNQTFMQTEAWQDKQLNACLASWAELRHDTILYAKQSYTMEAGSIPVQPPRVVGYVEPVPEFYARLITLTNMTMNGLDAMEVLDDTSRNRMTSLVGILERLLELSEKELANEELTDDDYDFIEDFATHLQSVVLNVFEDGTTTVLVADVHTDSNSNQVLEEGVGYIKILTACYRVPDGRILIGAGPTLSYYEFKQPMSNRLTDEAWKEILDSDNAPKPLEWNRSFDLDAYKEYGVSNTPPEILRLRILWNAYLLWHGRDKEDGLLLTYSYKVDYGEWSDPTPRRWIRLSEISEGLEAGEHEFWIKAIDSRGAESVAEKINFTTIGDTPPIMLFVRKFWQRYIIWLGKDEKDLYNVRYSYRIDAGEWSEPIRMNFLNLHQLDLSEGEHTLEVKAVNQKGLSSEIVSIEFIK